MKVTKSVEFREDAVKDILRQHAHAKYGWPLKKIKVSLNITTAGGDYGMMTYHTFDKATVSCEIEGKNE